MKQRPHIIDRIDRHPGHADVGGNSRMIRIIAAMGGEIESDRETFLSSGEVAPVEFIRLFGAGVARILADGPRLRRIHRGVGAAQKRRDARIAVQEVETGNAGRAIQRGDADAFRCDCQMPPPGSAADMFTGTKASCEKSGTRLIRQPGSLVKLPAEFANDSLTPFAMPLLGYAHTGHEGGAQPCRSARHEPLHPMVDEHPSP